MATRLKEYMEKREEMASDLASAIAECVEANAAFHAAANESDAETVAWANRKQSGTNLLTLIERIFGKEITVEEGFE